MESLLVTPKSKQSIPFLKHLLTNLADVANVELVSETKKNSHVAQSIDKGLKEVKEMISSKKKGKSLKQLLNED